MVEHSSYEHLHSSSQIVLGNVEVHTTECLRTSEEAERQQKRGERGARAVTSTVCQYVYIYIIDDISIRKDTDMSVKCSVSDKLADSKLELANWNWELDKKYSVPCPLVKVKAAFGAASRSSSLDFAACAWPVVIVIYK